MKRLFSVFIAAALALAALPTTAIAESIPHNTNWKVTYTTGGKLEDNYSSGEYFDLVSGMQPGDDITFEIAINHENDSSADWYLSNDVVKSLEEGAAQGSAYSYELSYEGPSNSRTLYSSEQVGGDNSQGLVEVDSALDDYLYLSSFKKGQAGKVTLKVTLDGETEGNDYFNTLARLKLKFAVEPEPAPKEEKKTIRKTVETGDDHDARLFPFYVAMVASGVGFAVLAAYSWHLRREERKEGAR